MWQNLLSFAQEAIDTIKKIMINITDLKLSLSKKAYLKNCKMCNEVVV